MKKIPWQVGLVFCAVLLHWTFPARASLSPYPQPLGQGSLDWLVGQSNPAVTGIQPAWGRGGLLVSYNIPPQDPLAFLTGRSWTYDNAVAAITFLLQGRPDSARAVLETLQGLTFFYVF